jgi:GntR family transcriptional regulator / MocR family aminotransferase
VSRAISERIGRSIRPGSSTFLHLDIREAPPGGRAEWLAHRLRTAIADGHIPVGYRLPASRLLALELGVSRGVVTEAYRRLGEAGHVAGRGRAGTVVVSAPVRPERAPRPERTRGAQRAARPEPARGPESAGGPGPSGQLVLAPFDRPPDEAVFDALRAAPARIDLTPGVPDLTAFPRTAWLRAERAVLGDLTPAQLGYGDARGTPELRAAVVGWLARNRGIAADPDDVVVVTGVAQALVLLTQVLREAGISRVAVEDPGSLGVRQSLRIGRLDIVPIPVDGQGVRVDELAASGLAAAMLTPAHQFPTGVVLHPDRRRALTRWADGGGLIIEDDYDAEHRYDRPPVPALHASIPDQVCYLGSVSKLLAPAMRMGWALVPPRYRDAFVSAKRTADLGNAALPQLVLAQLMATGGLERQLRLLRGRHIRRRDAMRSAIARHLPPTTTVHGVAAGLHLTITLDSDVDDIALAAGALAEGVKVQPLSWHRHRPGPPGLVLGYAATAPAAIDEGIDAIARALKLLDGPAPAERRRVARLTSRAHPRRP